MTDNKIIIIITIILIVIVTLISLAGYNGYNASKECCENQGGEINMETKKETLKEIEKCIKNGDQSGMFPKSSNNYLRSIALGIKYLVEKNGKE